MNPFEQELREARHVIRAHNDNPASFSITKVSKKRSGRHLYIREYVVKVSRGKIPPVTYEGGGGKNWVMLFAQDVATRRFSDSIAND
jgi:hypothetical protein